MINDYFLFNINFYVKKDEEEICIDDNEEEELPIELKNPTPGKIRGGKKGLKKGIMLLLNNINIFENFILFFLCSIFVTI